MINTPCSKEKYIHNFNVADAEVNILAVPKKKIQRLKEAEREVQVDLLSFSFCNIVEWTSRWVG